MPMREATTGRVYDLWSKVYDCTFGPLVHRHQARAVEQLRLRPGDRVLDIGVGTGLMLHRYRQNVTVVGMDLSAGMLSKARDRCVRNGLEHCRVVRGDAMHPPFAPASFDHVMISHTISVVSDPPRLLRLAAELVKPGGRIVLLNHFQSTWSWLATIERMCNPLFMKIGWRSDLSLEDVIRGTDLRLEYGFKTGVVDLWRVVVLRADHAPAPPEQAPPARVGLGYAT